MFCCGFLLPDHFKFRPVVSFEIDISFPFILKIVAEYGGSSKYQSILLLLLFCLPSFDLLLVVFL